jgi:peptide deformylase
VTVMPIRTFGDPVLAIQASDVDVFDDALAHLADDMFDTMYAAPGVGLAAPQVGLSMRFFVFDSGQGEQGTVANPVISHPEGEEETDEGCLSVPGLYYPTTRFLRVRIEGRDVHGDPVSIDAEGLLARIFQHETDHTNGLLYLDRLARRERKRAMADIRDRDLASARPRVPPQR